MEASIKNPKIPETDSIQELARFWDAHDLADFEAQLEEVPGPVFERHTVIAIDLEPTEAALVRKMAQAQGVGDKELVRQWVRERIEAQHSGGAPERQRAAADSKCASGPRTDRA